MHINTGAKNCDSFNTCLALNSVDFGTLFLYLRDNLYLALLRNSKERNCIKCRELQINYLYWMYVMCACV